MSFLVGGAPKTQSYSQPAAVGLQVQTSVYGLTIPKVYGMTKIPGNLIWYGDFQAIAHTSSAGGGGKGGGGGGGGSTTYTYKTSVMIGLCTGPIAGIGQVWSGKDLKTLADLGMIVGLGTLPQSPWPYLVTYHPDEAVGYPLLGYAAAAGLDLGDSSSLPNFNFEVQGSLYGSVSGKPDVNPAAILQDLLTDAFTGVGYPSARISDLTTYATYCLAAGLLMSPAFTDQQVASDIVTQIALLTNTAPVKSEGLLRMVPYGDTQITGNGVTYTPPSAPLFDFTDDDFLAQDGADPVQLKRQRAADAWNVIRLEYYDRTSQYDPQIAEAKDSAGIERFGLRFDSNQEAHWFADVNAAQMSAQLILQRQSVLNTYVFKLPIQWSILDPADIVTVTDAALGLTRQWVRITEIEEDEDGNLTFTVEEYLQGTGASPAYTSQTGSGYVADYNADPGDAAAPIIFEPPLSLTGGSYELWAATFGQNPVWGSANAWASTAGDSYKKIGAITGPARMGTVLADTGATLDVDIKASGGQLISGTSADAANLLTLCYVDGEYLAYTDALLIGDGQYRLSGLVRAAYGSTQTPHAAGSAFVRLDAAIFKYGLIPEYVGQAFFLKLQSVNIWGGGTQDISTLAPTTYYPTGKPILDPPPDVAYLTVQQNGSQATFQWPQVVSDFLDGYTIRYSPKGSFVWDNATKVTSTTRGTLITNSALPPGSWTVGIKAVDTRNNYSVNAATADITMANVNDLVVAAQQNPGWPGTLTNFVKHYTGILIPQSQDVASANGWDTFDKFVPAPFPLCTYLAPEIDLGFDEHAARVWGPAQAILGPGESGAADPQVLAESRLAAGAYAGLVPWTVGVVAARYITMEASVDTTTGVAYLASFAPTVDVAPRTEAGSVAVPVGGLTISFAQQFHNAPVVGATAVGSSALVAMPSAETTTGFHLQVFNTSGTDVGGTVNWTAEGA